MIIFETTLDLFWPRDDQVTFELLKRRATGEPTIPYGQRGEQRVVKKGEMLPFDFPEVLVPGLIDAGRVRVVCRPSMPVGSRKVS